MLPVKEKRKEGKAYLLRIIILTSNITVWMLLAHIHCWIESAGADACFQGVVSIGKKYTIYFGEQIQGGCKS